MTSTNCWFPHNEQSSSSPSLVGSLIRPPPDPPDLSQFPPLSISQVNSPSPSFLASPSQTALVVEPVNGGSSASASQMASLSDQAFIHQQIELDTPSDPSTQTEPNPSFGTV